MPKRSADPTAPRPLCRAPFASLRFNPGGRLFPCGQNTHFELGTYPAQSLSSIWNGPKTAALRKGMLAGRFAPGCGDCRRAALSGGCLPVKARSYDAFAMDRRYPAILDFKLQNTCNLSCIMCTSHSSSRRRGGGARPGSPGAYDSRFIAQLEEFLPHAAEAHFTGGEPFLMDIYFRIWERLAVLNPDCAVRFQTNGTRFDARVEGVLRRGKVGLNISIDSLRKRTFEAIRKPARFDLVRRNLERFRACARERGTRLNINTAVQRRNWREIPDIVRFCNGIHAQVFFCYVCYPVAQSLWALPAAELGEVLALYERTRLPEDAPFRLQNKRCFQELTGAVRAWHAAAIDARLDALLARPEDRRQVCDYGEWSLGLFGPDAVIDTILNEPLDRLRTDIRHFC